MNIDLVAFRLITIFNMANNGPNGSVKDLENNMSKCKPKMYIFYLTFNNICQISNDPEIYIGY